MNAQKNNSNDAARKAFEISGPCKPLRTGVSASVAGALKEIGLKNAYLLTLNRELTDRLEWDKMMLSELITETANRPRTESEAEAFSVLSHLLSVDQSWLNIVERKLARLNRA